ncbi:MAG TPA: hypothetical protein VNU71_06825 [Burkholderiaceae bacterium]|nr:hypothetical protein [Burkholderiaceae bacterium]
MAAVEIDVKQAVKQAFEYVHDLFQGEQLSDLGLEEVEYKEPTATWLVTVGFSRPWDAANGAFAAIAGGRSKSRSFKVVTIKSGKVISLRDRATVAA